MSQDTNPPDAETALNGWIQTMDQAGLIRGAHAPLRAEFSGWLTLLEAAALGQDDQTSELFRLAAFHARALGAAGRPASVALKEVNLLRAALMEVPSFTAAQKSLDPVFDHLLSIVVDAHGVGLSTRLRNQQLALLKNHSPILRLGETAVLGFLLGPMEAENIDALIGRLLREQARSGAPVVIIDVFGADPDTELFVRTVAAIIESQPPDRLKSLVLSGLRAPSKTLTALKTAGCDVERIKTEPDINQAIYHHASCN